MDDNAPATKADLAEMEEKLVERIEKTQADLLKEIREYIDERTHDAETRLLRAFSDYNISANVRFRKIEADTSNIDASATQRLGLLERQVAEFTMRLIALEGKRPA